MSIDLSKIKVGKIFKWLKKNKVSDREMISTFNCGVGFCVIAPEKNIDKIKRVFKKPFKPYIIGCISDTNKFKISNFLKW